MLVIAAFSTETIHSAATLPSAVAITLAIPGECPVMKPLGATVKTSGLSVVHLIFWFAVAGLMLTVSCCPTIPEIFAVGTLIETFVTGTLAKPPSIAIATPFSVGAVPIGEVTQ